MARRKIQAFTNGDRSATVYKDTEWGEYVVKLKGAPNADYHTDDKTDAVGSAKKMVGLAGLGAARHSRRKVERLVFPKETSAPWLTRVTSKRRGLGHKTGNMNFAIYRKTDFDDPGFGPGRQVIGKNPYGARVCIGKTGWHKGKAAGRLDSKFSAQKGDTVGCEWGGGKTPTAALARATQNLGRRLAKVKRGR